MIRLSRVGRVLLAATLGMSLVGVGGCGLIAGGSGQDTLKVCTSLPYEPFQYKDDSNKIVGFDVDMIDKVAKKLGKKQQITDTGFEPIKSGEAMENGTCAIGAAAITILPEREKVMDFSDPYYDSYQSLAVPPDSKVKDLDDLDGKTVGVQTVTTGQEYAEKHADENGYTVKTYRNLGELREALLNGQIEAGINDVPVWTSQINKDPDSLKITQRYDTGEQYGYAIRKGDKETLKALNEVIAETKKDGSYAKLYKKWIGEEYKPS